jgi:hypothetical protein
LAFIGDKVSVAWDFNLIFGTEKVEMKRNEFWLGVEELCGERFLRKMRRFIHSTMKFPRFNLQALRES